MINKTYQKLASIFLVFILVFSFLPFLNPTYATINETFNFQSKLTNLNGTNVTDGTYNFRFSIYNASAAGDCLWTAKGTIPGTGACTFAAGSPGTDLVAITVTNGLFNTQLGTTAGSLRSFEDGAASLAQFSNNSLYLDIQIYNGSSWETFGSRKLLEAVPYAFRSKYSDNAGTSTNVPISGLTLAGANNSINNGNYNQTWNWALTSASQTGLLLSENTASISSGTPSILGVNTLASSTAIPIYVQNIGGALSFRVDDQGSDTSPFVVDASGKVGIGTDAPAAFLHIKSGGGVNSGINLEATSAASYGVIDFNTASGLAGQFLATGASFSNGIFTGDQIALASYINTGSTTLVAGGTSGYINFATGGYLAANERMRIIANGNVGIGDTTPAALFTVGNTDLFQVNSSGQIAAAAGIVSSGTIQFSALTTNGAVYTSGGNGTLTTTAPTSGALGYWSRSGTTLSPTTANDILSITGNTGDILTITSSATGASNKGLNVSQTGATTGTDYGGYFSNTGAATTNVGLYSTATGATNNYAAIFESGSVGIGTTGPTARLSVAPVTSTNGRTIDAGASQSVGGDTFSIYNPISLTITDVTGNVYGLYNTGSSSTVSAGGLPITRLIGVSNVFTASNTGVPSTYDSRTIGMYTDITTTGNRNPVGYGTYYVTNSSSATGTQYVSYADMSAGTTTKWGLYFTGEANNYLSGKLGIGDTSPASALTVGSGDLFQVNSSGQIAAAAGIISSGTIQFSALTSNGALYTSGGNGTLTTTAPTSGALGYWSRSGTTLSPTTANDVISISGNTSDIIYATSSSNTASNKVLNVWQSGATSGTDYAGYFYNSGGSTTNVAIYAASAFSGGNDYAIITNGGNVGIGDISPTALLTVGNGDLFQVNSSGQIAAAAGVTSSGTITFSGLSAMGAIVSTTGGALTSVTSSTGNFLRHNGTTWVASTIQSGDIPTGSANYIQNQSASVQTANSWISGMTGIANGDLGGGGTIRFRKDDNSAWDAGIFQTNGNILTFLAGTGNRIDLLDSSQVIGALFDFSGNGNYLYNRFDDNALRGLLTLKRSRSSATAPNAGFGTFIDTNLEGFTNNSDVTASRIATFWENNQTNDTTDRDSAITFSTTLDNTFNEKVRISSAGNLGIGDTSPLSALTVGNGDLFQVNSSGQIAAAAGIISSGTIQFSALTTNGALYTSGSNGTLTTTAPTSGAIGYFSRSGTNLTPTTGGDNISTSGSGAFGATGLDGTLRVWSSSAGGRTQLVLENGNSGVGSSRSSEILFKGNGSSQWELGSDLFVNNTQSFFLYDSVAGATRLLVNSSGFLGILDNSPASALTVGNGDLFQVNSSGQIAAAAGIISSGTIQFSALTTNGAVYTSGGNGTLTTTAPTSGALGYWSRTSTTLSPTTANDILSITGNTGDILTITSSATGASNKGLNVSQTGATTGTDYGGYFSNTGTATTNVGLYSTATGATNNYSAIFDSGRVGIGTTIPSTKLQVGLEVIDDNGYTYDTDSTMFVHQTPTGTAVLNDPKTVLLLARQGANGQAYGAAAAFNLSRYVNSGTSSATRLDISLADTGFNVNAASVMTFLSNGNVGIGDVSPAALFTVGNTDLFQVNSSGQIAAAAGVTSSGTITFSGLSANGAIVSTTGGALTSVTSTTGNFLRHNGTTWVASTIASGDVPSGSGNYIQNQSASAQSATFWINGNIQVGSTSGQGLNFAPGGGTLTVGGLSQNGVLSLIDASAVQQVSITSNTGSGSFIKTSLVVGSSTCPGISYYSICSSKTGLTGNTNNQAVYTSVSIDNQGINGFYSNALSGTANTGTGYSLVSIRGDVNNTQADSTVGTLYQYGGYFSSTQTPSVDAGTRLGYAVYATATGNTNGASTAYAVFANATGADTNWSLYSAAGNAYIQNSLIIGSTTVGEKFRTVSADNTQTTTIGGFYANNLTQGVGFGYNEVKQVGSNTNEVLTINAKGTGVLNLQSTATGAVQIINNGVTTGNALTSSSTTLSSGSLFNLASTSINAAGNTQKVLNIATSGANTNTTQTTYGLFVDNSHTGTSSTNIAGYFSATNGTNNYGLLVAQGNVGIGNNSPTNKVDINQGNVVITSTTNTTTTRNNGYTVFSDRAFGMELGYGQTGQSTAWGLNVFGRATDTVAIRLGKYATSSSLSTDFTELATLLNSGNFGIGDITPAAMFTVGSGDLFQVSSLGNVTLNSVNTTQTTTSSIVSLNGNSLTSGTGLYAASSSLTSGYLVDLASSSTAITSGGLINATLSGDPAASWTGDLAKFEITGNDADIDGSAVKIGITSSSTSGSLTTALNVASAGPSGSFVVRFNDSGSYTDSSPFVVDNSGNVGIGNTQTPSYKYKLDVTGTTRTTDVAYFEGGTVNTSGVNGLSDQESMIPNSGFEIAPIDNYDVSTTANGWTYFSVSGSGGSNTISNAPVLQGSYSHEVTLAANTDGAGIYSPCIPITGGNGYNLYTFAKDASTGSNTNALTLRLATYTSRSNCNSRTSPTNYDSVTNGTVTTTSTSYGGTVTPASTQYWARAEIIFDTPTTADTFYADSVRLTISSLTAGVDLAESFPIENGYVVEAGDIVSVSNTNSDSGIKYIKKSSGEFDSNAIGIVSTKPGITLDDGNTYTKAKVALAGRVPVKISSLSETIKAGDYITSSSEEGKAMKASRTGQVIGKALNDWDPLSPTEKIVVLIDNSYYYHRDVEFAAFTDRLNALQNTVNGQTQTINSTTNLVNTTLNSNTTTTGPTLSGGFETLDLSKITSLLTKFSIETDGSLTFNSKTKFSDQLSVDSFVTKKISSDSSDILIELNETLNKNKLLVANKAGLELFSIDYKGNAKFARDVTINGDLYVDGKVLGKSVYESKWTQILPNAEISLTHSLGSLPRNINILRASVDSCKEVNNEMECDNVTNEGFGNKEVYYYKNLDKSSIKVVNALSEAIYVKVTITK